MTTLAWDANMNGEDAASMLTALMRRTIREIATAVMMVLTLLAFFLFITQQSASTANGKILAMVLLAACMLVTCIATLIHLPKLLRIRRALAELRADDLRQIDGKVVWNGKAHAIFVDGANIELPETMRPLMPADYTFVYLPKSRYVISARLATPAGLHDGAAQLTDALGEEFDFDDDDLVALRQGRLTDYQQEQVMDLLRGRIVLELIVGGLIVFGSLVWLILSASRSSNPSAVVGLTVIFGIVCGVGLCIHSTSRERMPPAKAFRVAEGVMTKTTRTHTSTSSANGTATSTPSYYFVMGLLEFQVSGKAYDLLVPNHRYQVYYEPYFKKILGMEPVLPELTS